MNRLTRRKAVAAPRVEQNAVWRATQGDRKVSARNVVVLVRQLTAEEKYWEKKRDAFVAAGKTENVRRERSGRSRKVGATNEKIKR